MSDNKSGKNNDVEAGALSAAEAAGGESARLLAERKNARPSTFQDMQLASGDRLQVQLPSHLQVPRTYVRLIGYLDKQSLIVTTPTYKGMRVSLLENESLVLRTFTRQSAFLFSCTVLRVCRLPFDYLHLSFPGEIKGTVIRKATRVHTACPVEVSRGSASVVPNTVIDNISATGALVLAPAPLGNEGDMLRVRFTLDVHGCKNMVELDARICNIDPRAEPIDDDDSPHHHGLEFVDPAPGTLMLLKGYVYQQIIERPQSLV